MNSQPYRYNLKIEAVGEKKKISKKYQAGRKVNFSKPVTNIGTKIYVLKDPKSAGHPVVYVGHTIQSISQISVRVHGKYNYKWLHPEAIWEELDLYIFLIDIPQHLLLKGEEEQEARKLFGEAVEAELVNLVKQDLKAWPAGQNEIHFNNLYGAHAIRIAESIYGMLGRCEFICA